MNGLMNTGVPPTVSPAASPASVVETAVRGMLPHNRLGRQMFKKLKVYAGGAHPHAAQKPEVLDFPEAKKS